MNILITGGAGYLGSILTRKLINLNYKVTVLDNLLYGYTSLSGVRANIRIRDIRDIETKDLVTYDIIIHLASIVGDSACDLDPKETININYKATKTIAEICKDSNKKIIYSSTCSVYGTNPGRISKEEDDAITPISLYGETKLRSERAIIDSGCDYLILRLGTLFGMSYRMRFDLAINLFIAQAIKKDTITVFGGEQYRPFLHIQDAADLIIVGLRKKWDGIYNTAWKNLTILEIAKRISKIFNRYYNVNTEIIDKRNYKVDTSKIKASGFISRKTLDYACGEIQEAYNLNRWYNYTEPKYSNHKYLFANKELMERIYTQGPVGV